MTIFPFRRLLSKYFQVSSSNFTLYQKSQLAINHCQMRLLSSISDDTDDDNFETQSLLNNVFHYSSQENDSFLRQNVIVIMPRQNIGVNRIDKIRAQFLLDETIALVNSVPNWNVISSEMVSTKYINSKVIFGQVNMELLKKFAQYMKADAVVFALDMFNPIQLHYLKEYLQMEVCI